jgi:hypothetical protein
MLQVSECDWMYLEWLNRTGLADASYLRSLRSSITDQNSLVTFVRCLDAVHDVSLSHDLNVRESLRRDVVAHQSILGGSITAHRLPAVLLQETRHLRTALYLL